MKSSLLLLATGGLIGGAVAFILLPGPEEAENPSQTPNQDSPESPGARIHRLEEGFARLQQQGQRREADLTELSQNIRALTKAVDANLASAPQDHPGDGGRTEAEAPETDPDAKRAERKAEAEGAREAVRERRDTMEQEFTGEERDARWADDVETRIYQAFSTNPDLAGSGIESLECRSSICRVVWLPPASESRFERGLAEDEFIAAMAEAGLTAGFRSGRDGGGIEMIFRK